MVFIVKVIDGVKKIIPVTADAGAGNPVGSLMPLYKKSNPSGYLYCDGSTFDQNAYPLLYAYLGSNVLPDLRECALVGAEQNTTDTIATHDVFAQGQFKDDCIQDFGIEAGQSGGTAESLTRGNNRFYTKNLSEVSNARTGTVTRGKRKAVYFYIKATSGLSENAQDNVINTLNEQRSYSTEEHLTGKKWIDGKPIYSKTWTGLNYGATEGTWTNVGLTISNCEHIVNSICVREMNGQNDLINGISFKILSDGTLQYISLSSYAQINILVLEYTKTT